jgi:pantothenate kinase
LERLAEQGYLQNNRQLDAKLHCLRISRIIKLICSMKSLVTLDLMEQAVTLEDLARVFQSCPQLINLHVETKECQMSEKAEALKNQLRSGFQKLRRLDLVFSIDDDTWPVIQEMLT